MSDTYLGFYVLNAGELIVKSKKGKYENSTNGRKLTVLRVKASKAKFILQLNFFGIACNSRRFYAFMSDIEVLYSHCYCN